MLVTAQSDYVCLLGLKTRVKLKWVKTRVKTRIGICSTRCKFELNWLHPEDDQLEFEEEEE